MAPLVLQENKEHRLAAVAPSQWVDQLSLVANNAGSYTVPANVDLLRVTFTCEEADIGGPLHQLWMRSDGSPAVLPAATIADGTGSEGVMQGDFLAVEPGQALSFISYYDTRVVFACRKCFVIG